MYDDSGRTRIYGTTCTIRRKRAATEDICGYGASRTQKHEDMRT